MNALLLPGMSPRHKAWIRQVAEAMRPHFGEVRLLDYAHWDTQDGAMDLELEMVRAQELAADLGSYVIVAKSIGTVLATLANARGTLQPQHCVCMGFPLQAAAELPQAGELAKAFLQLPPTTFIHNENDPLGSAEQVREYLLAHAPADYELVVTPGDTHDYVNFDQMVQLATIKL